MISFLRDILVDIYILMDRLVIIARGRRGFFPVNTVWVLVLSWMGDRRIYGRTSIPRSYSITHMMQYVRRQFSYFLGYDKNMFTPTVIDVL